MHNLPGKGPKALVFACDWGPVSFEYVPGRHREQALTPDQHFQMKNMLLVSKA